MKRGLLKYFSLTLLAIIISLPIDSYAVGSFAMAANMSAPAPSKKSKPRSSAAVKKERQKTSKEIEQTRKKLEANKKKINSRLNDLNRISADISKKKVRIDSLQVSIAQLDSNIVILSDSIARLEQDAKAIRKSMAQSLREGRKRRQSLSALAFVASSADFNQAMLRLGYLKQLDHSQANKTTSLQNTLNVLEQRKEKVAQLRQVQASNMNTLSDQQKILQKSQAEMNSVVADLRKNGKALEKEVKERQKKLNALDKELDRAIAEEQRIAAEQERQRQEAERLRLEAERLKKEAERNKQGKEPSKETPKPPEEKPKSSTPAASGQKADGASFAQMKGKLMAPVTGSYNIVGQFGRNKHAELSRVEIDNPGIDIETQKGQSARAVHDGVVSSIFFIDGYHNIVMVRHGEYLTIYANISTLAVRKGEKVKAGQNIGTIYSDPDDGNRTILHFEVRKERAKLNPLDWLKH